MTVEDLYAQLDKQYADQFPNMTEREKGLAYNPLDKELVEMRIAVRKLLYAYNNTPPANFPDGAEPKLEVTGSDRRDLLAKIFHLKDGHEAKIEVEPPLWLDYGCNVKFEGSFYCNFNATILDCAEVIIGDGVLFGPNVHLYGGTHSVNPAERKSVLERALPIKIGENCWMYVIGIG